MTDLRDSSTWPSLATIDPDVDDAFKAMGGPPDLGDLKDIPSLRKMMDQVKATRQPTPLPAGVKEEDRQIPMRDGYEIIVRIHRPETPPAGGSPLFVMLHGGGWCIGDLDEESFLCRNVVTKFGMTVVNVEYRLGPEWKFPKAQEDCFDATKWAAENASSLGADPSKGFILSGPSAGGQLVAVVSHLWRDTDQSPRVTGCHLMVPAVCYPTSVPENYKPDYQSWDQNEHAPILSRKACNLLLDNFVPNVEDRKNPLFSPLIFETGHKGLPKQYFQVCGLDPLRDEALIYERALREECGVETRLDVYPGQPHGYWAFFPEMKASKKWVEDGLKGIEWLLQ